MWGKYFHTTLYITLLELTCDALAYSCYFNKNNLLLHLFIKMNLVIIQLMKHFIIYIYENKTSAYIICRGLWYLYRTSRNSIKTTRQPIVLFVSLDNIYDLLQNQGS